MFTLYLDANLRSSGSNVVVNCLHPGVIWTGLYANASYVVYVRDFKSWVKMPGL